MGTFRGDTHLVADEYDVVVCGTGLKECILSGLLSMSGKKVLHLDCNDYYGGEAASLPLSSLYRKFRPGQEPPAEYGTDYHWSIDLIPKFVICAGSLVSILLKTNVAKYLDWKPVEGTYVYQYQAEGWFSSAEYIHKVPATAGEAAASPLMGMLEKGRCKSFFQFVSAWRPDDAATHQGMNLQEQTMAQIYEAFGLCEDTMDFIGHAVALETNDDYLSQPCENTLSKIQLYMNSFQQYGTSPFIYPLYGLGGIPEGFARLASLHEGTYMLGTPVEKIAVDEKGLVCGVHLAGKVVKCNTVICDPTYAPTDKTKSVGQVVRAICILGAPIPSTNDALSCQIILPQRQLGRKNDVYISMISWSHKVALKDKYIALVSTVVETDEPEGELSAGLQLLGNIEEKFVTVTHLKVPVDDGCKDRLFVTQSYDATSHFQTATLEVLELWKAITGADLDLQSLAMEQTTQEIDFDGQQ